VAHTSECQNYSHAYQNHIWQDKITVNIVKITLKRVKNPILVNEKSILCIKLTILSMRVVLKIAIKMIIKMRYFIS
jgi:hypothetical protein